MDRIYEFSSSEKNTMRYAYFPGCTLKGSAKRLDDATKRLFEILGCRFMEIPDWNCCGATEYIEEEGLFGLARKNLKKAEAIGPIVAACPACVKNLKEASEAQRRVFHFLDLLEKKGLSSLPIKRDLKGLLFTAYYGCLLLRPKEISLINTNIIEDFVLFVGGRLSDNKVKDLCCGGGQLFKNIWVTQRLSRKILDNSKGIILVSCPLCYMTLKTFNSEKKILYFPNLLLYVFGEERKL